MHALVILNHQAGSLNGERGDVSADAVREAFAAENASATVHAIAPQELEQTLRTAIRSRPDAVVIGGGDGTVNTAARCLVDTGIPLGVLPLGTLNHFARDAGIPVDWREAVSVLAHATPRAVDVGEVNGRVFINNCSIGSYPEAVRKREMLRHVHGRGRWVAMALATISVFRRLRRLRVRIDLPDTALFFRTPFVFIGNNRYSGHLLEQSLRPRLDEGQLSIYTTHEHRRLALLRLAWQSLLRSIDETDGLEVHATGEAVITNLGTRPLPLAIDGELVNLEPPLRFRIRPAALQVLAPPAPPAS